MNPYQSPQHEPTDLSELYRIMDIASGAIGLFTISMGARAIALAYVHEDFAILAALVMTLSLVSLLTFSFFDHDGISWKSTFERGK